MTEADSSNGKALVAALIFGLLGLICGYLATTETLALIDNQSNVSDRVSYSAATLYGYGVALGLVATALLLVYVDVLRRSMAGLLRRLYAIALGLSLVLTFLLPQLIDYFAGQSLTAAGYSRCEEGGLPSLFKFSRQDWARSPEFCP